VAENPIDLNVVRDDPRYRVKVGVESTEESAARIQEDAKAADYKCQERSKVMWFGMVLLFCSFCVFLYVKGSVDDKKWSLTVLASIITGIVTYAFRNRPD
jgi:fatty acid desaturase